MTGLNSTIGVPNTNSWNLDALGDWNSGNGATNTFNSQNEETANGSHTLAYDNAGDMTTDELGNTYVYDAWGHVVQIKNSGGSTLETFWYDALGRNDKANNGNGYTSVYYDLAGQQIESKFANTYAQYVWGLAYVNDVILRDRNADGSMSTGNLGISGSGLEEREYAQHDKQFSVISLTSRTGSVIQRLAYDPYGKMTTLTATWTYDSTGGGTNYWFVLFQGMSYVADGASGNLLQSQTRLYDVNLGRWVSQDWGGYLDGANRYQYVHDDPAARLDPSGLQAAAPCKQNGKPLEFTFNGQTFVQDGGGFSAGYARSGHANGRTYDYSKTNQASKSNGGIPEGDYTFRTCDKRNWKTSPFSHIVKSQAWGSDSYTLTPVSGTVTYGRSGFFLHGGCHAGSAGCINIHGDDQEIAELLDGVQASNACCCTVTIHVKYAQTSFDDPYIVLPDEYIEYAQPLPP